MKKQRSSDWIITFGIVADLQYCNANPEINRYFRNAPKKLKQAITEFNQHDLDYVINLGDTIDRDWKSFDEILPVFSLLKAPIYHVLGNHDYEVEDRYKPKVPKKIGTKKYHDFSLKNWRFIVLDGNEISTYANQKNETNYQKAEIWLKEEKINANFWNGGIGSVQLDWLEKTLKKAEENYENAIIFCHFPIYPAHRHNLLNDKELIQLISNCNCVKAWFCGHNHDGNYGRLNDVHFINVKGMADFESELAFSIVQLDEKKITITGFGHEITATLIL